jgi:cell wall assembly regulator SMI1
MYKYKLVECAKELTEADIANAEKLIGKELPPSLRDFYLLYNGGVVEKKRRIFVDEDGDIEAEVKVFLPIKYDEGDSTVEKSYENFVKQKKLIPPQFIPFAMDSGGFRYCIDTVSEAVFFNNLDRLDSKEGPMEFICASLADFIDGMRTEKEAYGD